MHTDTTIDTHDRPTTPTVVKHLTQAFPSYPVYYRNDLENLESQAFLYLPQLWIVVKLQIQAFI